MSSPKTATLQLSDEEKKARKKAQRKAWGEKNRDKLAANQRRYRENNYEKSRVAVRKCQTPDKLRAYWTQKRYGISVEEKAARLKAQGGVCAVCGADNPQRANADWAVDHCHARGHVRGILCHPCNTALGLFKDNVTTLYNAIDYLKNNGEEAEST